MEKLLTEKEASDLLKQMGAPLEPLTLRKLRCVGGGPSFHLWGRRVRYTEPELLDYVASRLSPPHKQNP
jgi:hypothetical protein